MAACLLAMPHRFGGTPHPVGATRQRNWVVAALRDLAEMGIGGGGVVQVAERNPPRGEVVLGAIIVAGWRCSVARHLIGALGIADVEQLAGQQAALDPPLVEI